MTIFLKWAQRPAPPEDAVDGAAWWLTLMQSPQWSPARHQELNAWLEANEAHAAAFARAERTLEIAADLAGDAELLALRARALSMKPEPPRMRYAIAASLVATFALGLALPSLNLAPRLGAAERFENPHGVRSSLRLTDGSHVDLNSDSVVEVQMTGSRRTIRLLRGQAWFDVAQDRRPFTVQAAGRTITDIGTSFDVRLIDRSVQVAVGEGRVAVSTAKTTPTEIGAGQRLLSRPDGGVQIQSWDVMALGDWRYGRVQFSGTSLSEAVAEMNRYTARPLRIGDSSLNDLKVSGVFFTDGSSGFLSALTSLHDVEVRPGDGAEDVILPARRTFVKKMSRLQ